MTRTYKTEVKAADWARFYHPAYAKRTGILGAILEVWRWLSKL